MANARPLRTCPMCGIRYDTEPALSRKDNQTEICPSCGMREAISAFADSQGHHSIRDKLDEMDAIKRTNDERVRRFLEEENSSDENTL